MAAVVHCRRIADCKVDGKTEPFQFLLKRHSYTLLYRRHCIKTSVVTVQKYIIIIIIVLLPTDRITYQWLVLGKIGAYSVGSRP